MKDTREQFSKQLRSTIRKSFRSDRTSYRLEILKQVFILLKDFVKVLVWITFLVFGFVLIMKIICI